MDDHEMFPNGWFYGACKCRDVMLFIVEENRRAARNVGRRMHLFVNYEFIFGDDRLYRNVLLRQNLYTVREAGRSRPSR